MSPPRTPPAMAPMGVLEVEEEAGAELVVAGGLEVKEDVGAELMVAGGLVDVDAAADAVTVMAAVTLMAAVFLVAEDRAITMEPNVDVFSSYHKPIRDSTGP